MCRAVFDLMRLSVNIFEEGMISAYGSSNVILSSNIDDCARGWCIIITPSWVSGAVIRDASTLRQ